MIYNFLFYILTSLGLPNLDYADLSDVCGTAISFRNASLNKANLKNVEFNESDFSKASLVEANLENARLKNIWFGQADLTQANFKEACLSFTNFENANMYMANLSGVEGVRVTLKKAFLKKANLKKINLVNSFFDDANLNEATLEKATLDDCSIYGVSLWGTKAEEIKLNNVYISPKIKESLTINNLKLAQTIYLHRENPSLTKKFIQLCQMEEEAVKLSNIIIKKYCEYSQTYGFRICSNIEQRRSNSIIPYCEIRETDNTYLFVKIVHLLQGGFLKKEIHEPRIILTIDDGIVESNLNPDDIEMLKGMVEYEEKTQKERIELIAPIVIRILDVTNSDEFIDENYTLTKNKGEVAVVTNWEAKIELMRVKPEGNQWQIINSSLSKDNCKDIQNIIEKLEKSS
ncbi:pentapeptide repeat-containing protein [Pleurocapsa sp. FMAR1]|uniref:pentapeptide repeat-containing protein n=1 Tax=Pleurocapsa sp. FMAR1 TaxID=3040204 RepID=UPI0029C87366|nr:pentapeptide repeat-containing protein [Pleurocapsa sp. FMAR1]